MRSLRELFGTTGGVQGYDDKTKKVVVDPISRIGQFWSLSAKDQRILDGFANGTVRSAYEQTWLDYELLNHLIAISKDFVKSANEYKIVKEAINDIYEDKTAEDISTEYVSGVVRDLAVDSDANVQKITLDSSGTVVFFTDVEKVDEEQISFTENNDYPYAIGYTNSKKPKVQVPVYHDKGNNKYFKGTPVEAIISESKLQLGTRAIKNLLNIYDQLGLWDLKEERYANYSAVDFIQMVSELDSKDPDQFPSCKMSSNKTQDRLIDFDGGAKVFGFNSTRAAGAVMAAALKNYDSKKIKSFPTYDEITKKLKCTAGNTGRLRYFILTSYLDLKTGARQQLLKYMDNIIYDVVAAIAPKLDKSNIVTTNGIGRKKPRF